MRAWPDLDVPVLPGSGVPVRLYDTVARAKRPAVEEGNSDAASLYVCGITPYDATHLGHAATYVAFDVLNRVWRDSGFDVRYVQNVTDIDDPLFERAQSTGEDWAELAAEQTELFRADMEWLRVLPPTHYVSAVDAIPQIIELINELKDRSAVYDVDGDLYFAVRSDPRFGKISGLDAAEMRELFAEGGGDPDRAGKQDPLDCLLWRRAQPGEPAWDSPFGAGRPGWHVECTAIALRYLGAGFDVQAGGNDLVFPHHEMCASEAHVATGRWPFARTYVHAGMVGYQGEKMSKSLGNLVFAASLRRSGADPAVVRAALYTQHYRSDWEWHDELFEQAVERLGRWRAAVGMAAGAQASVVLDDVRRCLADDLDIPAALQVIDAWADETLAGAGEDTTAPALVHTLVDALLGIHLRT